MKNNINQYLFVSLFLAFFATPSMGQMITFEKHYSTTIDQSGKDVLPTDDGGYMIAATTENSDPNDLDIHIIKTNAYGDIISTKNYGGAGVDFPNGILRTNDGNFFVIGYTRSDGPGDQDIYLLKLDQNGDLLYTKVYGGSANEDGKEIIATDDGNYLIVGASNSTTFCDMMLVKIQPDGTELWTKYYGGPNYQSARSVKLCNDGGFIFAGKTALNPTSMASIFLVRTNSNGDTIWTKTYSDPVSSFEAKYLIINNDGTYTLAADDSSGTHDSDVKIMKLTSSGGIIWNKTYGGTDKDITKTVHSTSDGGYVVGAISRSFGWNNPEMWILKLDANGDSQWTRNYGGSGHDHLHALRTTSDNGFIVVGHARSFSPFWEVYFLKLDPSGVVGISEFALNNDKFNLYPNPTNGIVQFTLNEDIDVSFTNFKISNSLGQIVYSTTGEEIKKSQIKQIDLNDQEPGMYFVTVETTSQTIIKKLVLN